MITISEIFRLRGLADLAYRSLDELWEEIQGSSCSNTRLVQQTEDAKNLVGALRDIADKLKCDEVLDAINALHREEMENV